MNLIKRKHALSVIAVIALGTSLVVPVQASVRATG
jgi:hypothetical protein